jgi:uncharacterized membrane protein
MKTMMMPKSFYAKLDRGIRFAVRVLHAHGFETCQSCQGGKGHPYAEPSVDLPLNSTDGVVFGALCALSAHGLPVSSIAIVWNVQQSGLINEKIGRITFSRTMESRADDNPMFTYGYLSTEIKP